MMINIIHRLIGVPLMVMPEKLTAILSGLGPRLFSSAAGAPPMLDLSLMPAPPEGAEDIATRPGPCMAEKVLAGRRSGADTVRIAVIPVTGPLVHRRGQLNAESGYVRSYQAIRQDIEDALEDGGVDAILLDIDSPGGEAAGNMELAEYIRRASEQKPLWAVANAYAYSAAYNIASAAGRLLLTPTAEVGSIGVIAVHIDQSGLDKKIGLKFTPVFAGEHKNDFSPHKPLSGSARQRLQEAVDGLYAQFVESVAAGRGLDPEDVRQTQALTFAPEAAIEAGLADEVLSFEDAVQSLAEHAAVPAAKKPSHQGETHMNKDKKKEHRLEEEPRQEAPGAVAGQPDGEEGAGRDALDAAIKEAVADAVQQERRRAVRIIGMCQLASLDIGIAAGLVEQGISPDEARDEILKLRAEEDAVQPVISTVSGMDPGGGDNPLLADARKRAAAAAGSGEARHTNPLLADALSRT